MSLSARIGRPAAGLALGLLLAAPAAAAAATIQAAANGSFVSATDAGAGTLAATAAVASTWEQFQVVNNDDGTISLIATIDGRYVSADLNIGGYLVADRTTASTWEKFQLVPQANGTTALLALANNTYVSADLNLGAQLIANRTVASTWEQFTIAGSSTGTCATAPGVPAGLSSSSVTNSSVTLSWTPPAAGAGCSVTGYRVYQDGVQVATPTGTSVSLGGLAAGATYLFTVAAVDSFGASAQSAGLSVTTSSGTTAPPPNFGSNVAIFDPTMPAATIQRQIDALYATQQNNQFGGARTAVLFKPGTYDVNVPVGFYTQVLGLGASPDDVTINGNVHSDAYLSGNNATCNFWRAVENLAVTPSGGTMQWAVAQATGLRRLHVKGGIRLDQNGGWSSGGWMSDDLFDGNVSSGTQQQWISRNTQWGSWTGANWNMVFVGDVNAPSGTWPSPPYTKVATTPIVREKPFLQIDAAGNYGVRVPSLRSNSSGITWAGGSTAGTTIGIDQFYVARAGVDTAATMNAQLAAGKHLLITPGVYGLTGTINVTRPGTIVLGLGYATLRADSGLPVMTVADVDGVIVAGLLFEAGAVNSPVLLQVGPTGSTASHAANPTSLHDVYFRVGGAQVGKATVSFQVNSSDVIVDHTWVWRADHGNDGTVDWWTNTAANGLVVNGNNVTIYGLFVEHYQQFQVLWNGNGGRVYFYQSEIPYDPPNQSSWSPGSGVNGWASYKVASSVTSHEAWGLGIYSVFTNGGIYLSRGVEVPITSGVKFHDIVTVCIGPNGGIQHVINDTGGATPPNVGNPPRVGDYP